MQNPEPSVDFDTVANVKQPHEVNVGELPNLLLSLIFCGAFVLHKINKIEFRDFKDQILSYLV